MLLNPLSVLCFMSVPTALKHQVNSRSCLKMKGKDTSKLNPGDSSRIWQVIEQLETTGLSTSNTTAAFHRNEQSHNTITTLRIRSNSHRGKRLNRLTTQVSNILREWGDKWAGQPEWQTLLNKKSLLHEIEESIVALSFFVEWLEMREIMHNMNSDALLAPVTLVDVCCGKGILSMLASYIFRNNPAVSGIIMLDKQTDINWNHIYVSNESAKNENRPIIRAWDGCNLNEIDSILDRLEKENTHQGQFALIGIHLCKLLSPSCAGLANAMGQNKCPFLCLAPCCLPRAVLQGRKRLQSVKPVSSISVRTYETTELRKARHKANVHRASAKKRSFRDQPCYLCAETGHPINKCVLLPSDEFERIDIFQKAAAQIPCWKCGEIGHVRADCTSQQGSSKPPLTLPPSVELDVSSILLETNDESSISPFQCYCELLACSIDRKNVHVYDVGLVNESAEHNNLANRNNWNRDRKSIYIVATS